MALTADNDCVAMARQNLLDDAIDASESISSS
jgi:hypothetical protein